MENRRSRCKSCLLTLLGFCIPFALLAFLMLGTLSPELVEIALGKQGKEALTLYLVSVSFTVVLLLQLLHVKT